MQNDNPMALANLLNSTPPELCWDSNSSTSSSSSDRSYSPPPISNATPHLVTLPSLCQQMELLWPSVPHDILRLARHPLDEKHYFPPLYTPKYQEDTPYQQSFIPNEEWGGLGPVPGSAIDIEIAYNKSSSRRRSKPRTLAARHRQQSREADNCTMPSRREINSMSTWTPNTSPELAYNTPPPSLPLPSFIAAAAAAAAAASHRSKLTHSNVKYSNEQVHYFRYLKEDLNMKWSDILALFCRKFPNEGRDSDQCLTSRFYRDNLVPVVTKDWNLMFGKGGKVEMQAAKVRGRNDERVKETPYTFIEKHPHRALEFDWVHPTDKKRALAIIEMDRRAEEMGCLSVAGKWRRVIKAAEDLKELR